MHPGFKTSKIILHIKNGEADKASSDHHSVEQTNRRSDGPLEKRNNQPNGTLHQSNNSNFKMNSVYTLGQRQGGSESPDQSQTNNSMGLMSNKVIMSAKLA